jgi:ribosomal protein S18 acetylase RimI-like enzyme
MTLSIKINEPVRIEDINAIFETINWPAKPEQMWKKIISGSTFQVQILDNDKVVAFGRMVDDGCFCMIYDVVVHSGYQKQGLGKKVMDELLEYAKEQKFEQINLFYWESNEGLDDFYKKFGFYNIKNGMRFRNQ